MIGGNDDKAKKKDVVGQSQSKDNMQKRSSESAALPGNNEPESYNDLKTFANLRSSLGSTDSFTRDKISQIEWDEKISKASHISHGNASTSSKSDDSRFEETIRTTLSNYLEYKDFLRNYDHSKSLYIYYTGTNSPNSGYSWCETCSKAFPLIEEALVHVHGSIFLIVSVGSQDEWQDRFNPYRLDKRLKLKVLPTLLKYKTPRRLEGTYCLKLELLELLFEDDADSDY